VLPAPDYITVLLSFKQKYALRVLYTRLSPKQPDASWILNMSDTFPRRADLQQARERRGSRVIKATVSSLQPMHLIPMPRFLNTRHSKIKSETEKRGSSERSARNTLESKEMLILAEARSTVRIQGIETEAEEAGKVCRESISLPSRRVAQRFP
jgi:hypothetical protein